MTTHKRRPLSRFFLGLGSVTVILFSSRADSHAPFYQGKTVTVIVSTSPAGTGDLRVKALMPFLRKHIPGNPTLVLETMDGGGGRKAANYMFRNARPDGLTVGAMSSGVISLNIMRESGVLYSTRPGSDRAIQNTGGSKKTAAAVTYERSIRSSGSNRSNPHLCSSPASWKYPRASSILAWVTFPRSRAL